MDNITIKVMADGSEDYSDDADDEKENSNSPPKKRRLYIIGGSTANKGKLTSIKKLLMLCIVPLIKETYENMKILFDLVNIIKIPFR